MSQQSSVRSGSRVRSVARRLRSLVGLGAAGASAIVVASASALTPSPPPGAPAVESAPSSLVGLNPAAAGWRHRRQRRTGSRWKPEKAIYGTASINDIASQGRRRNDDPGQRDLSDDGRPARRPKGPFPVLLTMTPYGKGQGGSSSPGSASSPSGGASDRRCRQLPGPARVYRGRRGRSRHRRLRRQLGTVRPDPAAGRDPGPQLGCAPAALRRPRGHLRAVVSRDRPDAAGRGGRPALAAEGDLPDGDRQRHLPRHVLHGRPARLRVRRGLPRSDGGHQHEQPGQRHAQRPEPARRPRRASRPTTPTGLRATTPE